MTTKSCRKAFPAGYDADADGDGAATLADFARFQNCFRPGAASAFCWTFDLDRNHVVTSADYGLMSGILE